MTYNRNYPLDGFRFKKVSSGAYEVVYSSDYDNKVSRCWIARIEDMTLIDATLNTDEPKRKDVDRLRYVVKRGTCRKLC